MGVDLIIIGAGELGQQLAHFIIEQQSDRLYGFLDDSHSIGDKVLDIPIIGRVRDYRKFSNYSFYIAYGYNFPSEKKFLIDEIKSNKGILYSFYHPTAYISSSAKLGNNVFIYPHAIIDKNVKLEDGVIVNLGAIISHDSIVRTSTFLAPGVKLSGNVEIGECSFLGTGSIIIDHIRISSFTTIGAGSVVLSDINKSGIYVGTPAKQIFK